MYVTLCVIPRPDDRVSRTDRSIMIDDFSMQVNSNNHVVMRRFAMAILDACEKEVLKQIQHLKPTETTDESP